MFTGTPFVVVYDASVIYPAPIRDALLWMAFTGLVQAKWTTEIHDEWIRNLLENRPGLDRKKLERTRDLMNESVPDSLIDGYQTLIPTLNLPDPDDRHVLAAAIRSGAQTIVTENLKDFPPSELSQYGITAERADTFLLGLIDINPGQVAAALRSQWQNLQNPPVTREEFLKNLEILGLAQSVAAIKPHF
jgi:hypothetical protein